MTTRKQNEEVVIPITLHVVEIVDKLSLDRNLVHFITAQLKEDQYARAIDFYRDKSDNWKNVISCC